MLSTFFPVFICSRFRKKKCRDKVRKTRRGLMSREGVYYRWHLTETIPLNSKVDSMLTIDGNFAKMNGIIQVLRKHYFGI